MAIEDPATVCDGSFEIGESLEAQMIGHMRHGSSPRLIAPQPIRDPNRREVLAIPSAGDRIIREKRFDVEVLNHSRDGTDRISGNKVKPIISPARIQRIAYSAFGQSQ